MHHIRIVILLIVIGLLWCGWLFHTKPVIAVGLLGIILAYLAIVTMHWIRSFAQIKQQLQDTAATIIKLKETNRHLEELLRTRNHELNQVVGQLNQEMEERRQLTDKLKVYATTDQITGLLNRDTGMALLVNLLHLAQLNQWPLTVCLMAINDLKQVNDRFGYQTGDEMVKAVSQIIRQSIRESDVIFRVGENEFIVIFPRCLINETTAILNRISGRLEREDINYPINWRIFVNYGLAEYCPGSQIQVMDLIKQAYQEMNKAKERHL